MFTAYYTRLSILDFRALCPRLITAEVISREDYQMVKRADESSKVALCILEKISTSLKVRTDDKFDKFLSVLEDHNDIACASLAKEIRRDLLKSTTGMGVNTCEKLYIFAIAIAPFAVEQSSHEDIKGSYKEVKGHYIYS